MFCFDFNTTCKCVVGTQTNLENFGQNTTLLYQKTFISPTKFWEGI